MTKKTLRKCHIYCRLSNGAHRSYHAVVSSFNEAVQFLLVAMRNDISVLGFKEVKSDPDTKSIKIVFNEKDFVECNYVEDKLSTGKVSMLKKEV